MNGRLWSMLALCLFVMSKMPDSDIALPCLESSPTGDADAFASSPIFNFSRCQHPLSGNVPSEWNTMFRSAAGLHLLDLLEKQGPS